MKSRKNISISIIIFAVLFIAIFSISYGLIQKSVKLFIDDKYAYIIDAEKIKISNLRDRFFSAQKIKYYEHQDTLSSLFNKSPSVNGDDIRCILNIDNLAFNNFQFCKNISLQNNETQIGLITVGKSIYGIERHDIEGSNQKVVLIYDISTLLHTIDKDLTIVKNESNNNPEVFSFATKNNIQSTAKLSDRFNLSLIKKNIASDMPRYFINDLIFLGVVLSVVIFLISISVSSLFTIPLKKITKFASNLNIDKPQSFPRDTVFVSEINVLYSTLHALTNKLIQKNKELFDHNVNLEETVRIRTIELENINSFQKLMMNSLSQAMFTINPDGTCGDIFTDNCESIFGISPRNNNYVDLVNNNFSNKIKNEDFKRWLNLVFIHEADFENCASIAVQELNSIDNLNGSAIKLEYYIIESAGKRNAVLVLATDQTEIVKNKIKLNHQQLLSSKLIAYFKYNSTYDNSIEDIKTLFNSLTNKGDPGNSELGEIHTLKGMLLSWGYNDLSSELHHIEGLIQNGDKVKVDSITSIHSKFESDHNEISQLISNDKKQKKSEWDEKTIHDLKSNIFVDPLKSYKILTAMEKKYSFQDYIQPFIDESLQVASNINKCVEFNLNGIDNDTHLTRKQELSLRTLVHIFKNSIIHGIEDQNSRELNYKTPHGTISVSTNINQKDGYTHIIIEDDGKGIDFEKLKNKYDLGELSENEILEKLFLGNLSTSDKIDINSGRGAGIAAVFNSVNQLDGFIECYTEKNKGTKWIITIPLIDHIESEANI